MKYQELTTKTASELYDSLIALKKELLGLRIQKSMGQLQNTAQIRKNRKDVARIMTRLDQLKNDTGSL
ncbi:50S ribosomal protein L29 [Candidatus Paracaedibacter symbiosus]|uniref:50S ribosomal protein L29 n=1 Tax=Candidatus Paracaedibacter symbiosus TaxID=244582 RepID=UPI0005095667|nr:50S ribosomal protein L29 [Candidatus Paracaedibacter symbiosus]